MTWKGQTSGTRASTRCIPRALLSMIIVIWSAAGALAADRSPRSLVAEANQQIAAGDIVKALQLLQQAASLKPESPEIAYDLGVAHYKAADYATAAEYFLKSLAGSDLGLEQKTRFNLGNCAYAEGLENQDDPKAALEKFRIAADRFREALQLDPKDADARANLERAGLMFRQMKEEQQKQEQQKQDKRQCSQPESQPSSQPENNAESQPSSRPDNQKQKEGQKQQGEEQQGEEQKGEEKEGEKQEGKPQAAEEKQGEEGEEKQVQPAGEQKSMNKEEAERLLQLIRDKERQRREAQYNENQKGRVREVPVDKDW